MIGFSNKELEVIEGINHSDVESSDVETYTGTSVFRPREDYGYNPLDSYLTPESSPIIQQQRDLVNINVNVIPLQIEEVNTNVIPHLIEEVNTNETTQERVLVNIDETTQEREATRGGGVIELINTFGDWFES